MELKTTVTKIRDDEVEISFESWTSKYPNIWRLVKRDNYIDVALPGRGGTFNLSYNWMFRMPLRSWKKTVVELIRDARLTAIAPHIENPTPVQEAYLRAVELYVQTVAEFLMKVRKEMTQ